MLKTVRRRGEGVRQKYRGGQGSSFISARAHPIFDDLYPRLHARVHPSAKLKVANEGATASFAKFIFGYDSVATIINLDYGEALSEAHDLFIQCLLLDDRPAQIKAEFLRWIHDEPMEIDRVIFECEIDRRLFAIMVDGGSKRFGEWLDANCEGVPTSVGSLH